MKFQCAFLYVAPNCDPKTQRAVIEGTDIDMNVIGCSTYAEAEIAAKELVEKGCTAIELCAGFGNEGIARIKRAVGPGIAVGAVKFDFHPAFEFKSGDDLFAYPQMFSKEFFNESIPENRIPLQTKQTKRAALCAALLSFSPFVFFDISAFICGPSMN